LEKGTNKSIHMKTEYPLWVKLGIWGCGSRQTIQIFIWLSIGLALAILLNIGWRLVFLKEGIDGGSFVTFCIFTLAFLHYYGSRRWVDKNGNWEEVKSNWASGFQMMLGVLLIVGMYGTLMWVLSSFY